MNEWMDGWMDGWKEGRKEVHYLRRHPIHLFIDDVKMIMFSVT